MKKQRVLLKAIFILGFILLQNISLGISSTSATNSVVSSQQKICYRITDPALVGSYGSPTIYALFLIKEVKIENNAQLIYASWDADVSMDKINSEPSNPPQLIANITSEHFDKLVENYQYYNEYFSIDDLFPLIIQDGIKLGDNYQDEFAALFEALNKTYPGYYTSYSVSSVSNGWGLRYVIENYYEKVEIIAKYATTGLLLWAAKYSTDKDEGSVAVVKYEILPEQTTFPGADEDPDHVELLSPEFFAALTYLIIGVVGIVACSIGAVFVKKYIDKSKILTNQM